MEDELGVSNQVSSITIPLGATVNMDAVSILMSFMIMFFANACNVNISISMMVLVLLANVLLSVGTPGIPGGAIASFAALATMAGLPAGVMGVYISINTLCDMGATCVNVIGDMAGCVVLQEQIDIEAYLLVCRWQESPPKKERIYPIYVSRSGLNAHFCARIQTLLRGHIYGVFLKVKNFKLIAYLF